VEARIKVRLGLRLGLGVRIEVELMGRINIDGENLL